MFKKINSDYKHPYQYVIDINLDRVSEDSRYVGKDGCVHIKVNAFYEPDRRKSFLKIFSKNLKTLHPFKLRYCGRVYRQRKIEKE